MERLLRGLSSACKYATSWELLNDFHEIWYWIILTKIVVPFQFGLKSHWITDSFHKDLYAFLRIYSVSNIAKYSSAFSIFIMTYWYHCQHTYMYGFMHVHVLLRQLCTCISWNHWCILENNYYKYWFNQLLYTVFHGFPSVIEIFPFFHYVGMRHRVVTNPASYLEVPGFISVGLLSWQRFYHFPHFLQIHSGIIP